MTKLRKYEAERTWYSTRNETCKHSRCTTVHTRRTIYGDSSFAVSGTTTWNSLPVALRLSDAVEETSGRHLKTFLFNCFDNSHRLVVES